MCIRDREVVGKDAVDQLPEGDRHLDPRRPTPDDHERERSPFDLIGGEGDPLEPPDDVAPERDGLFEVLQPEAEPLSARHAEAGRLGAGGEDEPVERDRGPLRSEKRSRFPIDTDGLGHAESDVRLLVKHAPDRVGDLLGLERARRDLVQQGLEQVVVRAVDERDLDGRAGQRLRETEAPEPRPDADDAE